MIASERRRNILKTLNRQGIIDLKEVAKQLNVAEITVRRDFEKLEAEGKLKRVQGGAEAVGESAELTMTRKLPVHLTEKRAVAAYAADLAKDGDCVFLDGGTTILQLAELLVKRAVTIVTHNTLILPRLVNPTAKIILIGGEYQPQDSMNIGPMAQEMLRQFHFDIAFLGCAGMDLQQQAVYSTDPDSMAMKRIAIEQTKHCILLADHSKFIARGYLQVCALNRFESIVTDRCPDDMNCPENLVNLSLLEE